jgi:hypothetical protein
MLHIVKPAAIGARPASVFVDWKIGGAEGKPSQVSRQVTRAELRGDGFRLVGGRGRIMTPTALIKYDAARTALAEAHRVDSRSPMAKYVAFTSRGLHQTDRARPAPSATKS